MPELPEVETIVRELSPLVCGRRLEKVDFLWAKTLLSPSSEQFDNAVIGQTIAGLTRRGKYLVFALAGGKNLLVHLRMTGSLLAGRAGDEIPAYTRAVLKLDDDLVLFFIDPRKFGKFQLVDGGLPPLETLGVEPLADSFTPQILAGLLAGRAAPVKSVLLNQQLIAGIGNMYADEALFAAGIHPLTPASRLSSTEVTRLHNAVRSVLTAAIAGKGASISNYFRPGGETGSAHRQFKVAHRRHQNCYNCNTAIERLVIGQRGTYFCPHCQREKPLRKTSR